MCINIGRTYIYIHVYMQAVRVCSDTNVEYQCISTRICIERQEGEEEEPLRGALVSQTKRRRKGDKANIVRKPEVYIYLFIFDASLCIIYMRLSVYLSMKICVFGTGSHVCSCHVEWICFYFSVFAVRSWQRVCLQTQCPHVRFLFRLLP